METEETSLNFTTAHHENTWNYTNEEYEDKALLVYTCIILSIEIAFLCLAIYTVFFLTKFGQGAPVFVINVQILDLIQIVSFILVYFKSIFFVNLSFVVSFLAALYFMTCIDVERYLLIAHPIWYQYHHPVKCLVCTSLTGWLLSCILFFLSIFCWIYLGYIMPFLYYLVIVFCFLGACRALSHSQSITSLKRRLVVATLLFVLLSYTFSILPFVIMTLLMMLEFQFWSFYFIFRIALMVYMFNPIVDCLLYVFMRSDAEGVLRMPHCCSKRREIQSETQLTNVTGVHSHV